MAASTWLLSPCCVPTVAAAFSICRVAKKKGCRDIVSCKAYIKEFVSQWLEQLPAHDRGHAWKSREHTQSGARCSAYFLPVCRPPVSGDAGRGSTCGGDSDETHRAASN